MKIKLTIGLVIMALMVGAWQWERSKQGVLIIDGQVVSTQSLTITQDRAEYIEPNLSYQGSAMRFQIFVPHDTFSEGWHTVSFTGQYRSFNGTFCKVDSVPSVGGFTVYFRDDVRGC
jgi:hypothetical protein